MSWRSDVMQSQFNGAAESLELRYEKAVLSSAQPSAS